MASALVFAKETSVSYAALLKKIVLSAIRETGVASIVSFIVRVKIPVVSSTDPRTRIGRPVSGDSSISTSTGIILFPAMSLIAPAAICNKDEMLSPPGVEEISIARARMASVSVIVIFGKFKFFTDAPAKVYSLVFVVFPIENLLKFAVM